MQWNDVPNASQDIKVCDPSVQEVVDLLEAMSGGGELAELGGFVQGHLNPLALAGLLKDGAPTLWKYLCGFVTVANTKTLRVNDYLAIWDALKKTSPFFQTLETGAKQQAKLTAILAGMDSQTLAPLLKPTRSDS